MIDARILPLQRAALQPPAEWLAGRGIGADAISVAGFLLGLLAVPALACGAWTAALVLIAANRLMDGLDGAVARIHGPTDRGAFLDISLDFLFYALVPLGFALHDPAANALPAAVLIAAFTGTGSSFLAFAAIAARRGERSAAFPQKGLYYLGGLTEGAETIAVFLAMCLVPQAFPLLAWGFAAACAVTTILRWRMGWTAFR
ncbi:CDP-alcohol phosphatidyltransferase family protein [Poseidonocella sp. HB161398]|uniref:CDP-alcohol phosphatidyltransferase family protein n=1 Tax=Poseidonocella sp. HB161398 TaxID=2320855 RepID=UPI001107F64E|nr:CDP-alcohol phosphatidyltransferase family protein [Poseidonocella sp. HB161398]